MANTRTNWRERGNERCDGFTERLNLCDGREQANRRKIICQQHGTAIGVEDM